jgi:hypothetical protein
MTVCALMGISFFANSQSTQTVDLSTGVVNGTSTLIAVAATDDTWTVQVPGSSTYTNIKCADNFSPPWGNNPNARWISPYQSASGTPQHGVGGIFLYKMTFTASTCLVSGATINLVNFGGDNTVTDIQVNTNHHALSATFYPLSSTSITLAANEIIPGLNTIIIELNNINAYSGLVVSGNLVINYAADPNLTPSISGTSTFCSGTALTFTGSDGVSTATNHYWEILESDAWGTPTGTGYSWFNWYAGTPGVFTIPNYSSIPCGKYYKIKLAVVNACTGWAEISKVIFINCAPVANAGADVTICKGSCTTIGIGGGPTNNTTYNWIKFVDEPIPVGSGQTINVCPGMTTYYTLTVTNTLTGCKATDQVTVNVVDNKPNFNLASNLNTTDNFYTLTGNPVNTNVSGIAGFGYSWIVEEIVSSSNTTVVSGSQVVNSSCWWSGLSNNFNGYDGVYFTNTGLNPMNLGCGNPILGKFTAGHAYRITRGTWSSVCPWQQYSVIAYMTHSPSGSNIHTMEDTDAPDYSGLLSSDNALEKLSSIEVSVYPNPGTSLFTIETGLTENITLEVFDMVGKRIISTETDGQYKLDLSGYSKGIYMIKMTVNNKPVTKKIILE